MRRSQVWRLYIKPEPSGGQQSAHHQERFGDHQTQPCIAPSQERSIKSVKLAIAETTKEEGTLITSQPWAAHSSLAEGVPVVVIGYSSWRSRIDGCSVMQFEAWRCRDIPRTIESCFLHVSYCIEAGRLAKMLHSDTGRRCLLE